MIGKLNMQAVILAAGKGTRLAPITNTRSKGMLPILGKPILERIIGSMVSTGLRSFILVVNPEDLEVREYFQNHFSRDVHIEVVDQEEQLGAAHALGLAAPLISGDFVLSACDSLVPESEMESLLSTWTEHRDLHSLLSLESIPIEDAGKTGIVTLEGDRVMEIIEKPAPAEAPSNISSTPLYVFSNRILDYLPQVLESPRGEYELQDAIQLMIDDGLTVKGLFLNDRLTLTDAGDLLAINLEYLYATPPINQIRTKHIGSNMKLVEPVFIEQGVKIGSNCKIGPGVYIEKNVSVGDDVQLENSVVLRKTTIPGNTVLRNNIFY